MVGVNGKKIRTPSCAAGKRRRSGKRGPSTSFVLEGFRRLIVEDARRKQSLGHRIPKAPEALALQIRADRRNVPRRTPIQYGRISVGSGRATPTSPQRGKALDGHRSACFPRRTLSEGCGRGSRDRLTAHMGCEMTCCAYLKACSSRR
jgi:hypothetical protein